MEDSNLVAWLALVISVITMIKDITFFFISRQKKVAASVDYNFELDRLDGIIITSLSQKPVVIDGFKVYRTKNATSSEKVETHFGSFESFIYKKLNYYESYRISVGEEYGIRFNPGIKYFLELSFLGSTKTKILDLN